MIYNVPVKRQERKTESESKGERDSLIRQMRPGLK